MTTLPAVVGDPSSCPTLPLVRVTGGVFELQASPGGASEQRRGQDVEEAHTGRLPQRRDGLVQDKRLGKSAYWHCGKVNKQSFVLSIRAQLVVSTRVLLL